MSFEFEASLPVTAYALSLERMGKTKIFSARTVELRVVLQKHKQSASSSDLIWGLFLHTINKIASSGDCVFLKWIGAQKGICQRKLAMCNFQVRATARRRVFCFFLRRWVEKIANTRVRATLPLSLLPIANPLEKCLRSQLEQLERCVGQVFLLKDLCRCRWMRVFICMCTHS